MAKLLGITRAALHQRYNSRKIIADYIDDRGRKFFKAPKQKKENDQ